MIRDSVVVNITNEAGDTTANFTIATIPWTAEPPKYMRLGGTPPSPSSFPWPGAIVVLAVLLVVLAVNRWRTVERIDLEGR